MKIPADHIEKGLYLTIEPVKDNFRCEIIDDAIDNGESKYQIGEGQFYQYEFSNSKYGFEASEVIEPFKNRENLGRISPNIYVGTLELNVKELKSDLNCGKIEIEVQSVKASYRTDYRKMLENITEYCFDLILQLNVPIKQNLSIDFGKDNSTDYQRFAFVQSIIDSDTFSEALQRIISFPTTKWSEQEEITDLRRIRRLNKGIVKQIVSNNNRVKLPDRHNLRRSGLSTIPQRIKRQTKIDSVDTQENRFVKHVLEVFLHFVLEFERNVKRDTREAKAAKAVAGKLEEFISHNLFKSVSRPVSLRLNSPVLQRKEGYREVLRAWVMFDLAAKLIWSGGDDVYKAGKKDIATLYEYWLFFKLLNLFKEIFNIGSEELSKLIVPTKDKLGLQLKQGKEVALCGISQKSNRELNIRFSYNRSFAGSKDYPTKGSWTKSMRPDYTLSIWPSGLDEDMAENEELITHIHFDAKYKIESFVKLMEDSDLSSEKSDEAKGKYKNADLLKMHAYRDAIRRTSGAYVLYPGAEIYRREGFHEILPGLGAFPMNPSTTDTGSSSLKSFIDRVVENLTNRASQKELYDSRKYLIHKYKPSDKLHDILPENFGPNRDIHPLKTTVIVGYYKDKDHLTWINRELLYNFRINSDRGSIPINKDLAGAKYILLHGKGKFETNRIFKIDTDAGAKIYTKDELIKKGYPDKSSKRNAYLVFPLVRIDLAEFGNVLWDIRKLKKYKTGRVSAKPFTVKLSELMSAKI